MTNTSTSKVNCILAVRKTPTCGTPAPIYVASAPQPCVKTCQ